MVTITLIDGTKKEFKPQVSILEIAESISKKLAKEAVAAVVDDKIVDLSYLITTDATVNIVTANDPEGIEVVRHSCAHVLAQATQRIFPDAQVTIGPVIENGFYYDFSYSRPFTPEDLVLIEQEMGKIVNENLPIKRTVMSCDETIEIFKNKGESYKVEIIQAIPGNEEISCYTQGEFLDVCRGPHVPSTGKIKAFKLMKIAGAYWRGDAKNEMLQRIYGIAFSDKKKLKEYLHFLEEAEKRDHRKIGKKQDLFHLETNDPGMIFWHPNGWTIYQIIEQYIRAKLKDYGYLEVKTPQLVSRVLWEKSGHWDKFRANMFTLESEKAQLALKPMNCPCHLLIYNQGLKSYRDLPLRLSEFGSCHRYEPSGALHGIMRILNFVQDDAHIFCTEDQILSEVATFIRLLFEVYADFGFNNIIIRHATRPDVRVGSDEIWDKAEQALTTALQDSGLDYELAPGEGAFYGPKLEFSLKDCLGRVWQCGTIQVDFSMPERLGAHYIAEDGSKHIPVMLHRAVLGSIERFIGILLEDTAGALPVWLASKQVAVLTITDDHHAWAKKIINILENCGFRVLEDLRNEKIGFKIREHSMQKVPYLLIIGGREVETKTISVRYAGEDKGVMQIDDFIAKLDCKVDSRGRN